MSSDRVSYMHQRDPSIDRRYRPRPNNVRALYKETEEEDIENITNNTNSQASASSLSSLETADNCASVFLRLRPNQKPCKHYVVEKNTLKVQAIENVTTNNKDLTEKHFDFSNIFHNEASQFDVYNHCVNTSIEHEENLTVLTYGTSGSGKTYTMYGSEANAGIVQRAIVHIFTNYENVLCDIPALKLEKGNITLIEGDNLIVENELRTRLMRDGANKKNHQKFAQAIRDVHGFTPVADNGQNAFIWMSFVEIYNENVYDMLNPVDNSQGKRKNLKIIANDGNSFIKDLTSVHVRTADEAYAVLNFGLEQVKYASTNINTNSSRSHCILIIHIIQFTPHPDRYSTVTYKFCDLAGSERLKKTENVGNRLKEAQRINTSLLVLGRCLDLLYHNQQLKTKEVVPFRESKLTLLLQRSLIGREKITTIVNMMPTIEFMEENLHVLNFASIAQKIVYNIPKPKAPAHRAARSTRFSWFMNSQRNDQRNDSDWNDILSENDRLENENLDLRAREEALLEHIQKLHSDYSRQEQELRIKLVEEREQQLRTATEKWEIHCKYIEKRAETQVS